MTKDEIGKRINPIYPRVYSVTTAPTKLAFKDGSYKVGYFQPVEQSMSLEKENKFTFVEFGDRAQYFKATQDPKYLTIVAGDDLLDVEYPSYSEELMANLRTLKRQNEAKTDVTREDYKRKWVESISSLNNIIIHKWLNKYEEEGLLAFSLFPVSRNDAFIGEYITSVLEMTLTDGRSIILEPYSSITTEYNGRLDLYMRGNIYKKVSVMRTILTTGEDSWILAYSNNYNDQRQLNKDNLEALIIQWVK